MTGGIKNSGQLIRWTIVLRDRTNKINMCVEVQTQIIYRAVGIFMFIFHMEVQIIRANKGESTIFARKGLGSTMVVPHV